MEFQYPSVAKIGIPAALALIGLLLFIAWRRGRSSPYRGGVRAAGADRIRKLRVYRNLRLRWRILWAVRLLSLTAAILTAVFLAARPSKNVTTRTGVKKRDIFLCLDASRSICEQNYELVDRLEDIVRGLDGDRIGVSIFNTTTVLYVPMTDDYDFAIEKLEELKTLFGLQKEFEEKFGQYEYYSQIPDDELEEFESLDSQISYYEAGILVDNTKKGSSLIGEGLATCLYSFPRYDREQRTRIIILSTDNDEQALETPMVELPEAAKYCKKGGVTVFGLFPGENRFEYETAKRSYEEDKQEMQKAVEDTGGAFYVADENLPVAEILNRIAEHEAMAVRMISTSRMVDQPEVPVIVLTAALLLTFGTGLVLRR
jgi:hypothetical protein